MAGAACLLGAGCASSGPLQENPVLLAPNRTPFENPVFLPQGPASYNLVFGKVLDVVSDYFEVAYSNRYEGRIETFPRVAPGLGEPWKPGSPDLYQRTLATFQSLRLRAVVLLSAADDGGYFVDVKVYRELEDVERPAIPAAAAASFRTLNTVERQYEVVEAAVLEPLWIPIGRDAKLEQLLLERIAHCEVGTSVRTADDTCRPPAR